MQTWNDADDMLRAIAVIDLQVEEAASARDAKVLDAQTEYSRVTAPKLAWREVTAAELEGFYKTQRKKVEADGKRSIDLNYGRVGMRLGKPTLATLKGWKWEKVLNAIKQRWGRKPDLLESLVNTKETVNKDGVKSKLSDEDLAAVGLKIKQDDEFFFETFPEKLRKAD